MWVTPRNGVVTVSAAQSPAAASHSATILIIAVILLLQFRRSSIHDKVVLISESGEIMFSKFLAAFAILAIVVASAGTVPGPGSSYRVTLSQPSVVKGSDLKPGEYKVSLGADKATFSAGKINVEAAVTVETAPEKFKSTAV